MDGRKWGQTSSATIVLLSTQSRISNKRLLPCKNYLKNNSVIFILAKNGTIIIKRPLKNNLRYRSKYEELDFKDHYSCSSIQNKREQKAQNELNWRLSLLKSNWTSNNATKEHFLLQKFDASAQFLLCRSPWSFKFNHLWHFTHLSASSECCLGFNCIITQMKAEMRLDAEQNQ